MIILHQADVVSVVGENSHCKYGSGEMLKRLEDDDGTNVRYFVRWPDSSNGIAAGWYTSKDIIVAGWIYQPQEEEEEEGIEHE